VICLAVIAAFVVGFAAGHYRLKRRIFRRLTRMPVHEIQQIAHSFRKVRSS